MTELSLVIVHRGPEYDRDFSEIAVKVREIDPGIAVYVTDDNSSRKVPAEAWRRPVLIVSLTPAFRLRVRRGEVMSSRLLDKIVQTRMALQAGIAAPPAMPFSFGMWLDPVLFGDFVIIKPRDPALTSSGKGVQIFRRAKLQSIGRDYFPSDHPIFSDRVGYLVQRYVHPGPTPTYNRVLTFLGRPIYMAAGRRVTGGADLSATDAVLEASEVTIQGGPIVRDWGVADDVLDMAKKVAVTFLPVPLLAIDIIREHVSGKLYFIECNPGGNTWHFSSTQPGGIKIRMILGEADKHGKAKALELGRQRMIEQTGAFDIVARALAEETRARAR